MQQNVDDETRERLHMMAPAPWLKRIDDWRRHQPDLPNRSESIRRLVDIALGEGAKKSGEKKR